MNYSEDKGQAGEYLRLTLGYLAKYNQPASPVNYTIWYEYVSGKNQRLRKAIDTSIESAIPLTDKNMETLYQKYVADGDRIVISKLLTKINLMLREITRHVLETEGDLFGHGRSLSGLSEQIRKVQDYEGIKQIVDKMILETKALITSGSRLQSRMKISSADLQQLYRELEKSQQEAQTDSLTGLINRRGLEKRFELERIRAKQNNFSFSIILLDIDHFKRVNDTYGHLVGDSLLRGISGILKTRLRRNDIAARYGGEEFLILLPETDLGGADAVAVKIQKDLSTKEWKLKESGQSMGTITVSMGISMYAMNEPGDNMIKRADDALYMAKNTGRNKIVSQASIQG
ncbi:MAG: GGDEF domain-containing protein [Proteobacteria bacterium]|nr:GGDEF domain-containing protein [Pseudomonadota bacterium]